MLHPSEMAFFFKIGISFTKCKLIGNTGSSGSRDPYRGSANEIQIEWSTFFIGSVFLWISISAEWNYIFLQSGNIYFLRMEIHISSEWKYLLLWNGNTGLSGSRNPCRGSASDIQIGWSTFLSDVTHRTFYFSQNMLLLWKYSWIFTSPRNKNASLKSKLR